MIDFLNWVGRISSVIFVIAIIAGFYGWFKGILPMIRLGNGFEKENLQFLRKAIIISA